MIDFTLPIWNGILAFTGTVIGLVLMYWLKPFLDKKLNRDTKTFGVIYEKKFLIYNEIVELLIDSRSKLVFYTEKPKEIEFKLVFENIVAVKKNILHNRLVISIDIFKDVNFAYRDFHEIYDKFNENNDQVSGNIINYELNEKIKDHLLSKQLDVRIINIIDKMKKELSIK